MAKRLEHLTIEESERLDELNKSNRARTLSAWLAYAATNELGDVATEQGLDKIRTYPVEKLKPLRKALNAAARLPELLGAIPVNALDDEPIPEKVSAEAEQPLDELLDNDNELTDDASNNSTDEESLIKEAGLSDIGLTWLKMLFSPEEVERYKTLPLENIVEEVIAIANPPQSYVDGDKNRPVDAAGRLRMRLQGEAYSSIALKEGATTAAAVQVWFSTKLNKPIKSGASLTALTEVEDLPSVAPEVAHLITSDTKNEPELKTESEEEPLVAADSTARQEPPFSESLSVRSQPEMGEIRAIHEDLPHERLALSFAAILKLDSSYIAALQAMLDPKNKGEITSNKQAVVAIIRERMGMIHDISGKLDDMDPAQKIKVCGFIGINRNGSPADRQIQQLSQMIVSDRRSGIETSGPIQQALYEGLEHILELLREATMPQIRQVVIKDGVPSVA